MLTVVRFTHFAPNEILALGDACSEMAHGDIELWSWSLGPRS